MEEKSRVLIIGSTGNLGYHLAESSLKSSHPTLLLVRESAFHDPIKAQKLQSLTNAGAAVVKGSLQDESSLVEALKRVDIVICSIPSKQAHEQKLLIKLIKQAGSRIKRFIPSEFGADADRSQISGMDHGFYSRKAEIRRLIEAEAIPYTYICCNLLMSFYLPSLVQPGLVSPPRDKVTLFGTGDVKGVFVKEQDVAAFTMRAVDDPSTLNKTLYLRPSGNVCSMNELVTIWEGLIAKNVERCYVSEEQMLNRINGEIPYPKNMELVFIYSVFVKGDHTYYEIDPASGVEGSKLYPDVGYTTVAEYLSTLV
ncbi:Probable pinoresinol-lariciresinol reductase 3 [Linum grandiflorum]